MLEKARRAPEVYFYLSLMALHRDVCKGAEYLCWMEARQNPADKARAVVFRVAATSKANRAAVVV